MFKKSLVAAAIFTAYGASSASALWVRNYHLIHRPIKDSVSVAIDPVVQGRARYTTEFTADPVLGALSGQRPMHVEVTTNNLFPVWARTYMRPGENANPPIYQDMLDLDPNDQHPTSDGGMIICGNYVYQPSSGAPGANGTFLLKVNAAGGVQWYREYPRVDSFNSVIEVPTGGGGNGGYIVCGDDSLPNAPVEALIVRTDPVGNVVWSRNIWSLKNGVQGDASFNQVIFYSNPQQNPWWALTGYCNERTPAAGGAPGDADVLLTLVDTTGGVIFNAAYGATTIAVPNGVAGMVEVGNSLATLANGAVQPDIVITGNVTATCLQGCNGSVFDDILAMRIVPGGGVAYSMRYDIQGQPDSGVYVKTQGGRTVVQADTITNYRSGPGTLSDDVALLRLDPNGNPWFATEIFGGPRSDTAAQFYLPTANNPVHTIMLNTTLSYGVVFPVPYLIERLPSILHRCQDNVAQHPRIDTPMPRLDALWEQSTVPSTPRELVAVNLDLARQVICKKILVPDLNLDGVISVADIGPFVMALTRPDEYLMTFGEDADLLAGDLNGDGELTVSDIGLFVEALTNPPE